MSKNSPDNAFSTSAVRYKARVASTTHQTDLGDRWRTSRIEIDENGTPITSTLVVKETLKRSDDDPPKP